MNSGFSKTCIVFVIQVLSLLSRAYEHVLLLDKLLLNKSPYLLGAKCQGKLSQFAVQCENLSN